MVQRVHFAYDDEELPDHWGMAGGCFPYDDEDDNDEDWEDDFFEPIDDGLIPEVPIPDFDSSDQFIDNRRNSSKRNGNRQPEPGESSLPAVDHSLQADSPIPPPAGPSRNQSYM